VARAKFEVGEPVEMRCLHRGEGQLVLAWLVGSVVAADYRMLGVRFETDVFANTGLAIPDRILWCTHGSPNLRRPGEREQSDLTREVNSDG
jgi:hypothetical protein